MDLLTFCQNSTVFRTIRGQVLLIGFYQRLRLLQTFICFVNFRQLGVCLTRLRDNLVTRILRPIFILLFISISILLIMNLHIPCMLLDLVSQLAHLASDLIIKCAKLFIFVLQGSGVLVSCTDQLYHRDLMCKI